MCGKKASVKFPTDHWLGAFPQELQRIRFNLRAMVRRILATRLLGNVGGDVHIELAELVRVPCCRAAS